MAKANLEALELERVAIAYLAAERGAALVDATSFWEKLNTSSRSHYFERASQHLEARRVDELLGYKGRPVTITTAYEFGPEALAAKLQGWLDTMEGTVDPLGNTPESAKFPASHEHRIAAGFDMSDVKAPIDLEAGDRVTLSAAGVTEVHRHGKPIYRSPARLVEVLRSVNRNVVGDHIADLCGEAANAIDVGQAIKEKVDDVEARLTGLEEMPATVGELASIEISVSGEDHPRSIGLIVDLLAQRYSKTDDNLAGQAAEALAQLIKRRSGVVHCERVVSDCWFVSASYRQNKQKVRTDDVWALVTALQFADDEDWDYLLGLGKWSNPKTVEPFNPHGHGGRDRVWKGALNALRDFMARANERS